MSKLSSIDSIGFFDLETTGLDVHSVRIVTASVGVLSRAGHALESHGWLVNPGIPIPASATAVHGITDEIAERDGANAKTAVLEILQVLCSIFESGVPVVAFNAAYDFSIIAAEAARHGLDRPLARPVFDPLVIDRKKNKFRKGKRTLVHLAEHYGVPLLNAHTAEADAVAAAGLAFKQLGLYPDLADLTPNELHDLQIEWADEQARDFESYMQQRSTQFRAERGWPVRILS